MPFSHFVTDRAKPLSCGMTAPAANAITSSPGTPPLGMARVAPTTSASRIQAITSLIAAQVRAATPSSVLVSPRSVRIRASTGNAVIDIATPMNSANAVLDTPAGANASCIVNARPAPSTNGTRMLACDVTISDEARCLRSPVSNSRPTRNM